MSAFEFVFGFYGLLLGLSVAVIATGLATAIQHRKSIRIGWLTPLLALFVGLDIASFWDSAWTNFRHLPFTYGLLVAGLAIALVYFIAASLVFPHAIKDGDSLDDHFWANKRVVLLLTIVANSLLILAAIGAQSAKPDGRMLIIGYLVTLVVYIALVVPAAFARRPRLFAILIGLHVAVYLLVAAASALIPQFSSGSLPAPGTVSPAVAAS